MALYGGALATAGATFAWLLWAFVRSALSDPRIIIAAVIGAAIGELVHWVRHYLAVARAEATGAAVTVHSPAAAPAVGGATGALGVLTRLRAAIGLTLVFGAVATEHFAAHVVNEIYVPFLASVATLFPVGVVFGLAFEARRQRIWEPLFVPIGLAAGVFAGLIVVLLHAAMDGSASFSVATLWNRFIADAAWWGLVGVCMGTAYALRWRLPAATGACLPFVVLVVVAFTDPRSDARWFRAVMNLAGTWTDALLDAPDTPSWFWTLADAEMNDSEEPSESAVVREPKPSRWREAIRTSAICARHESLRREIDEWQQKREAKIDAEIKAFPPSSDADHRSFKDQIEELARQPTSDGPAAVSRNAEPVPPPADDTLADSLQQNELYSLASDIEALRRVDRLCQQLGRGLCESACNFDSLDRGIGVQN